jgi:hypothetical protein
MEGIMGPLFAALVKFGVFIIFISAIVEVYKDFSFVGITTLVRNLLFSLFKGQALDGPTIRFISFLVGLFACWAWDYGLISSVIEGGSRMHAGPSGWIDWIGTSAAQSMGAAWVFDRFVATAKLAAKAKADAGV